MDNNRHPVKRFFVTLPHSEEITREEFLLSLPPVEWYLVSKELHSDGTPHLHAIFSLKEGLNKKKMIDYMTSKWTRDTSTINVQKLRNVDATWDYLLKEDSEPLLEERKKKIICCNVCKWKEGKSFYLELYKDGEEGPCPTWNKLRA